MTATRRQALTAATGRRVGPLNTAAPWLEPRVGHGLGLVRVLRRSINTVSFCRRASHGELLL
jgi:hypothetical protein